MLARLISARFTIAAAIMAGTLLAALPARALGEEPQAPPGTRPTPVTRQEVWQAVVAELRKRGLAEQQLPQLEDVDLPAAIPALAGRRLEVSSACWDGGLRRTQFRLECGRPGQCLPFLAYLHNYVRDSVEVDAAARAESCRQAPPRPAASRLRPAPEARAKPAVRAGDRAIAVFLADRMRMTASVTCMEHGREGEIIRVRSPDGHIFRARVSGPARLEALPQ